jgi:hypothetical protein
MEILRVSRTPSGNIASVCWATEKEGEGVDHRRRGNKRGQGSQGRPTAVKNNEVSNFMKSKFFGIFLFIFP